MSRILSVLLAFALVLGAGAIAKADVTGSFEIHIQLNPETRDAEAVKFEIDFQTNLDVQVTLSGLTFGADLGFGVTGVEFAVLSVSTNLGALAVDDEFVFASPFGCSAFPAAGNCAGNTVVPVGGDATGVTNAVGFVKKRIGLELNIAGITLSNLAMFEDVDFPDIRSSAGHEHDHFLVGAATNTPCGDPGDECEALYFLNGVNNTVDDQTPTFGFGDVITITGQTVSGITVSGATALCASGQNTIKKKIWTYEVNEACTAEFGNGSTALEGGAKTPLLFEQETLSLSGIEIGGVGLSISTTWTPLNPIVSVVTASFDVLDLASVTVTLISDNITNLSLDSIVTSISSGNLSVTLIDIGGNLDIDVSSAVFSVTLNQNQNPASLTVAATSVLNVGITSLSATLSISRAGFTVSSTTSFTGAGTLNWSSTSFAASLSGGTLSVDASVSYSPAGMSALDLTLGLTF